MNDAGVDAAVTAAVTQARAEYEALMTDWEAKTEQWRKQTVGACEELLSIARTQLSDATADVARLSAELAAAKLESSELRARVDELRLSVLTGPPKPLDPTLLYDEFVKPPSLTSAASQMPVPSAPTASTVLSGVSRSAANTSTPSSTSDVQSFLAQPVSVISSASPASPLVPPQGVASHAQATVAGEATAPSQQHSLLQSPMLSQVTGSWSATTTNLLSTTNVSLGSRGGEKRGAAGMWARAPSPFGNLRGVR